MQHKLYDHDGQSRGTEEVPGWYELTMSVEVSATEIDDGDGDRYGTGIEVRYHLKRHANPHEIDYEILYVIDKLAEEIDSARLQKELLDILA